MTDTQTPTAVNQPIAKVTVNHDDQYRSFREGLNLQIDNNAAKVSALIANPETQDNLRLVRLPGKLASVFINNIDESIRQQYNCESCKRFFNGYGSLGFLTKDLKVIPLAFPTDGNDWEAFTGDCFKPAYLAVLAEFENATNVDIVTVDHLAGMGDFLGVAECGGFNHIHKADVAGARSFLNSIAKNTLTAKHGYGKAEITQIHDAFQDCKANVIDKPFVIPHDKLRERDVYEYELCLKMTQDYLAVSSKMRSLWVTRYLMDLGLGILHFRNTVVWELIVDSHTLPLDAAMNNYYAYTDPTKYKRKVALPQEKEFAASVEFLTANDYAEKLQQRFATIDEGKELFTWMPAAKTTDMFAAMRAKVTDEKSARALAMPLEKISRERFERKLDELLGNGTLKGIAIKSISVCMGTLTRNLREDAGNIYKDGRIVRPIYMAQPIVNRPENILFDSAQADGLFRTTCTDGRDLTVLAFGNATINFPVETLNYVEDLIPELHPHQRTIDTWGKTTKINPTLPDGKVVAGTNAVVLVALVPSDHTTISLITDNVVLEYRIVCE